MLIVEEIDEFPSPVAVFREFDRLYRPAWLDANVDAGKLGRFSLLAADPFLEVEVCGERIIEKNLLENHTSEIISPFFPYLSRLQKRWRRPKESSFLPFESGLIGYLGYELGHQVESFPRTAVNDLKMPDAAFAAYDTVLVFDHLEERCFVAATGLPLEEDGAARRRAESQVEKIMKLVDEALAHQEDESSVREDELRRALAAERLEANFSPAAYRAAIGKILDYIAAGDIYQVNLSQRFTVPFTGDCREFYLKFRNLSPAPFGAYLETGRHCIMSNSPERYLLIRDDYIETRPIKGTRPRGADPVADEALGRELLRSSKDRAEHLMIVDLERNDLGRVAAYGSVHVPEMMILESYANVHHMVSTVAGRVRPGVSSSDCLLNSFPGGSITGAPKLRSMEIIDELEPTCRGVYTGSIGYLDFSGDLDFNIAIRTAVACDGQLHFQVGGGIVADSDPDDEYRETETKAASFLKAIS
ncbi:MAG: aminodeoxychorismate synthase component I [Deltaproteobacteria bacterium]|nr:aminodeoxychorismate synthase component I [Deltaproteobacteria bacterium]